MGNAILFPSLSSTYTVTTDGVEHRLVWIEDKYNGVFQDAKSPPQSRLRFPALFYFCNSPHTLLYFHGNSVDLGDIADEMEILHRHINANILAVEFPGYGVCKKLSTTASGIDAWGRSAFQWLVDHGVHPNGIILFGRSIGTGPAAKLASDLRMEDIQTGGVILHSPYESIHKIVSDYSSIGTWIIANHWDTEKALSRLSATTPLLIIHGENDEVIPVKHSKRLFDTYNPLLREAHFFADCPHNAYLIIDHLASPIKKFCECSSLSRFTQPPNVELQTQDRRTPPEFLRVNNFNMMPCCGPAVENKASEGSTISRQNSSVLVVHENQKVLGHPMVSLTQPNAFESCVNNTGSNEGFMVSNDR